MRRGLALDLGALEVIARGLVPASVEVGGGGGGFDESAGRGDVGGVERGEVLVEVGQRVAVQAQLRDDVLGYVGRDAWKVREIKN